MAARSRATPATEPSVLPPRRAPSKNTMLPITRVIGHTKHAGYVLKLDYRDGRTPIVIAWNEDARFLKTKRDLMWEAIASWFTPPA